MKKITKYLTKKISNIDSKFLKDRKVTVARNTIEKKRTSVRDWSLGTIFVCLKNN